MKRSRKILWCRLVTALLTLPLLQTSCVEIVQRSVINGFLGAATPLADERLEGCLTDVFAGCAEP